jgi:hypothetical protein
MTLTELAKQCGATEVPVYTPTHRAVIGWLFGRNALTAFVERIREEEREKAEQDAKRYRWLRKGNDYQHEGPMVLRYERNSDTGEEFYWSLSDAELDAAVDSAIDGVQEVPRG